MCLSASQAVYKSWLINLVVVFIVTCFKDEEVKVGEALVIITPFLSWGLQVQSHEYHQLCLSWHQVFATHRETVGHARLLWAEGRGKVELYLSPACSVINCGQLKEHFVYIIEEIWQLKISSGDKAFYPVQVIRIWTVKVWHNQKFIFGLYLLLGQGF